MAANCTLSTVRLLYVTHQDCADHEPGRYHPERRERLAAARDGLDAVVAMGIDVDVATATPIDGHNVTAVHDHSVGDLIQNLDARGGGQIDGDTTVSSGSWRAAQLAAGSVFDAMAAIDTGAVQRAFCAVRPPGHHATPIQSMGFCLLNSVAIAATWLRDRGERVAIVDLDAHHGNGTQDAFENDPSVLYASIHQWPFYPGTGAVDEVGRGDARGTTINIPVPSGTCGTTYRDALDRVVIPAIQRFAPTWMLLSIGYDAHRDDPLTALGLTSGDYGDLLSDLVRAFPNISMVGLLEGGYDLDAVTKGVIATLCAFAGSDRWPEQPTSGGPNRDVVDAAAKLHRQLR